VVYEEKLELRRSLRVLSRRERQAAVRLAVRNCKCPMGGTADDAPLPGNPPALIVAGNPTGPWPCGWQGVSNPSDANWATDKNIPAGLSVGPFNLSYYDPPATKTGDLWHIFWHEQLQIDTGKIGTFERLDGQIHRVFQQPGPRDELLSRRSDGRRPHRAPLYDGRQLPFTALRRFVPQPSMADLRVHAVWNQPLPTSNVKTFDRIGRREQALNDSNLTTMPLPQNSPGPQSGAKYMSSTPRSHELAAAGHDTRSTPQADSAVDQDDRRSHERRRAGVSWKWYSGRFAQADRRSQRRERVCSASRRSDQRNTRRRSVVSNGTIKPFVYLRTLGRRRQCARREPAPCKTITSTITICAPVRCRRYRSSSRSRLQRSSGYASFAQANRNSRATWPPCASRSIGKHRAHHHLR